MSDEENNQNDSGTEEHDEERGSPAKSEEARQKSHSPPPRSRSSRHDGPPPTKLYVGNLPEDCKRSELSALFEKYGKLEKCDVLRSFAFVVSFRFNFTCYQSTILKTLQFRLPCSTAGDWRAISSSLRLYRSASFYFCL